MRRARPGRPGAPSRARRDLAGSARSRGPVCGRPPRPAPRAVRTHVDPSSSTDAPPPPQPRGPGARHRRTGRRRRPRDPAPGLRAESGTGGPRRGFRAAPPRARPGTRTGRDGDGGGERGGRPRPARPRLARSAAPGMAAWPSGPRPPAAWLRAPLLVGALRGGLWGLHTMPRECCSLHLRCFLEVLG